MADEVKLYGSERSAFVYRVKMALNMKEIKYEYIEEDLSNKSEDLLKYNPVHKKVPILVHNGNPISESLVIVEYIDDVWKGVPILPQDPYQKAVARFWAKFIDEKIFPTLYSILPSKGQEKGVLEAGQQLLILENELDAKGDNINLVDIAGGPIAYWLGILEEAAGIKIFTKDKFPKLTEWLDELIKCQVVKDALPPREHLIVTFKKRFGIA